MPIAMMINGSISKGLWVNPMPLIHSLAVLQRLIQLPVNGNKRVQIKHRRPPITHQGSNSYACLEVCVRLVSNSPAYRILRAQIFTKKKYILLVQSPPKIMERQIVFVAQRIWISNEHQDKSFQSPRLSFNGIYIRTENICMKPPFFQVIKGIGATSLNEL